MHACAQLEALLACLQTVPASLKASVGLRGGLERRLLAPGTSADLSDVAGRCYVLLPSAAGRHRRLGRSPLSTVLLATQGVTVHDPSAAPLLAQVWLHHAGTAEAWSSMALALVHSAHQLLDALFPAAEAPGTKPAAGCAPAGLKTARCGLCH